MKTLIQKILALFRYVPYEERRAREEAKLKEAHDTAYSDAYFRMLVRGFSDTAIDTAEAELHYVEEFSHLCSTEAARARGIEDAIDAARVARATRNLSVAPPDPSQDPDDDAGDFEYLTQAYRERQTRWRKEEQPEPPAPMPAATGRRMRIRTRKRP